MKITTRKLGGLYGKNIEVIIASNGTSIDLGIIGESEASCLIESFESAIDDLRTFVSDVRERAIAEAREVGNNK